MKRNSEIRTPRRRLQLAAIGIVGLAAMAGTAFGAVQYAGKGAVAIGNDDDNTSNPVIQPEGVEANQSLRNSDFLIGGAKDDVLVGRLGPDVLLGNYGSDVLVGGLERGSDVAEFPNFDTAHGGKGDDFFIWAPGDGSDAFVGGEDGKWKWTTKKRKVVRADGTRRTIKKRVRVRRAADEDRLLVGLAVPSVSGDNTTPELFPTRDFGPLPRVNISGGGQETTGDSPALPLIRGFCEIVPASPGLGYSNLVRFFREDNGNQAVTIRVKQVESVYCPTRGADTITEFTLGPKGNGPVKVETTDFRPEPGSKLAALLAGDPAANAATPSADRQERPAAAPEVATASAPAPQGKTGGGY